MSTLTSEERTPRKGEQGGECNRTACRWSPATAFNKETRKFYCRGCAMRINEWAGEKICNLEGYVS